MDWLDKIVEFSLWWLGLSLCLGPVIGALLRWEDERTHYIDPEEPQR